MYSAESRFIFLKNHRDAIEICTVLKVIICNSIYLLNLKNYIVNFLNLTKTTRYNHYFIAFSRSKSSYQPFLI